MDPLTIEELTSFTEDQQLARAMEASLISRNGRTAQEATNTANVNPPHPMGRRDRPHSSYLSSPFVFTAYGVSFFRTDVDSLEGGEWYTDPVIQYYEEHLKLAIPSLVKKGILLIKPCPATAVMEGSSPCGVLPDAIGTYKYVFAPLARETGQHWSLLLIVNDGPGTDICAYHFDNTNRTGNGGTNEACAQNFLSNYQTVVGMQHRSWRAFRCNDSPRDSTSFNCGPVVCWVLRALVKDIVGGRDERYQGPAEKRFDLSERLPLAAELREERTRLRSMLEEAQKCWVKDSAGD
jgi:hypothetical protein